MICVMHIAAAYEVVRRYKHSPINAGHVHLFVVKHDKWTSRSCTTAGHTNAITFIELGFR